MTSPGASSFRGPRIVAATSLAMALLYVAGFVAGGGGEESIRAVVRATAQTSLFFFLSAFIASSLRAVWPTPLSRWMLANRRYLGISMGISHFVHLGSLIALGRVSTAFANELNAVTLVFGGFGFVVCFAMALTSNNRAVKWLGAPRWRRWHKFGAYYLWFIFFQSYVPRMFMTSPVYGLPVALLAAAMALRFWAWKTSPR